MLSPYYPVAIWFQTPTNDNDEAEGEPVVWYKAGAQAPSDDELSLTSLFHKVRHDPVTPEAYRFAAQHGIWADTIPDKYRTISEVVIPGVEV